MIMVAGSEYRLPIKDRHSENEKQVHTLVCDNNLENLIILLLILTLGYFFHCFFFFILERERESGREGGSGREEHR